MNKNSSLKGGPKVEAIYSLEDVKLNGSKQFLSIRGTNIDNPLILYIHGGPGIPELPLLNHFNHTLEQNFIITYWEQRGTGKSYSNKTPAGSYTIQQFIKDGYDLSRALIKRFKKEKIYIIGHSWGTIISTRLVTLYPELYHAYIGIGQMVDVKRGEELSYKFVVQKAIDLNNSRAIKSLSQINSPTFLTINNNPNWYKQLKTERKWLTHFGGLVYNKKRARQYLKLFVLSPYYSLFDLLNVGKGNKTLIKRLWPEIMKIKLLDENTEFKLPVYFFQGIYDYNCPTELVQEYFQKIKAPVKELFIFSESAHTPNFEEHERFNNILIEKLGRAF